MKLVKIFSAAAIVVSLAVPAFAGSSGQSNSAYSGISLNTNSGPGYGAALAGGTEVSTAMTGPSGASTSVAGLTTAQTLGHATAGAAAQGNATAASFQFKQGGLHW